MQESSSFRSQQVFVDAGQMVNHDGSGVHFIGDSQTQADQKSKHVVRIDSVKHRDLDPEPPAQSVGTKRAFFGNQHTERRFFGMYERWRDKVSIHYRIPAYRIDEQIFEAMQQRRAIPFQKAA